MCKNLFNLLSRLSMWLIMVNGLTSGVLARADVSVPTNSYWKILQIDPQPYSGNPYRISLFDPQNGEDGARLWSQSKSIFIYGLGVVGVLVMLPESATGWDPNADIFGKWIDNVRDGPEWDRNNWAYNYIGHTYCGGVYYQVARKSGYRQWDSFIYSFLMSTFYWEYGVEAFAERPSIQDLAVTPLMGWVYGEWAYQKEIEIRDNGNEVMGSKALGSVSLFLLDPIDVFGRAVNHIVGRKWVKAGYGYFTYTATPVQNDTDHTVMLNFIFPVGLPSGPAGPEAGSDIRYADLTDPVDYGIVGLSLGAGYANLDKKWQVDDTFYRRVTLGLYVTPRFSSRLAYARGDAEETLSGSDLVYENYSLDFQYSATGQRKLRPYVTGGFGEIMWNKEASRKSFQLNAGLGLHWQIHDKWAVNSDWINYFDPSRETHDQNINVGVIYRFGEGEHAIW